MLGEKNRSSGLQVAFTRESFRTAVEIHLASPGLLQHCTKLQTEEPVELNYDWHLAKPCLIKQVVLVSLE